MNLIRVSATVLLFVASFFSYAENCSYGCSTGASGQIIERPIYTLQNNANTKFTNWVAYKVINQTIDGSSVFCMVRWSTAFCSSCRYMRTQNL